MAGNYQCTEEYREQKLYKVMKKPPMWAGETATSYFPMGLPPQYHQS